jgi:phosphoribosylamine--glycine ligase
LWGGCASGDSLEDDRSYGQKILSASGIPILPSRGFRSIDEAVEFVEKVKGKWVIKQNGHASKIYNYVGQLEDGSDVIHMLRSYQQNNKTDSRYIELQQRVDGIEIGVGRYFNGKDWVGPIEMNIEHKDLYTGNLGPKTFEMGTLMWYDDNENNKLFQLTLARLKDYLQSVGFRGDVDINCIVDKDQVYPLEVTARFGFPSTQLQVALHISPWGEFLKAVADGRNYDLLYRKGYGMIVLIATPPFPYRAISKRYSSCGLRIFFKDNLSDEEMSRIHFEEVSFDGENYYVSGDTGFVAHVSGVGESVKEARENVYGLIQKIVVPKMFYRNDIGLKFENQDFNLLKKWGWIA